MAGTAKCIAFANQKGGTGKTTSCISIAGFLAKGGNKVLVVDFDPQANATSGLGIDGAFLEYTVYDAIIDQCDGHEGVPLRRVIVGTDIENLHLAPSEPDLIAAEVIMPDHGDRTSILKRTVEVMRSMYDYILIDLPSTLGFLTINGLCASDQVVVTLDPSVYSLEAFENLKALFNDIKKMGKHPIDRITAILIKYVKQDDLFKIIFGRRTPSEEVMAALKRKFEEVFVVPESMMVYEAQKAGIPISHYAPRDRAGRAYAKIAQHIGNRPARGNGRCKR